MLTQAYQIDNQGSNQGSKARKTATLCLALALLTMATTSWFVVEGIQATEPASSARWAKVAAGVLLLILELSAFGLAGQWPEYKKVLRPLGWFLLALEITLMSVSQISIGMTAGKAAAHGKNTTSEILEQAKEGRENSKEGRIAAAALRAEAKILRKSKDPADKEKAKKKEAEAAEFSKSSLGATAVAAASAAVQAPADAVALSTPLVEIVGQGGLIALSVSISVALSLSGIALMHVSGSLRRRAGGCLTVEDEILQMLREMRGMPAPAVTSFKTGTGTVAPVPPVPTSGQAGVPGVPGVPTSVQQAAKVNKVKTAKPRVQKEAAVRDTGTVGKSAGRYELVKAGVIAGTVKPSIRGIQAAEGGSKEVVGRYIKQLAADGVIVPSGRGYALAVEWSAA